MTISPLFDDDTTPKVKAADVPCGHCAGTGGIKPANRRDRRRLARLAAAADVGGEAAMRWRCDACQGTGKIRLRDLGAALPTARQ